MNDYELIDKPYDLDSGKKKSTIYLIAYAISESYFHNNFVPQSKLVNRSWVYNEDGSYVSISGYWCNPNFYSVTENYFVVEEINGVSVAPDKVYDHLMKLCEEHMDREKIEHGQGIVFFGDRISLGYEYPILDAKSETHLSQNQNVFNYFEVLRYAFASSIAYSQESTKYPFEHNAIYKELMLGSSHHLEIVDEMNGNTNDSRIWAVAVKVPAVERLQLKEEIIIAFKGSTNTKDLIEDAKLTIQNFFEFNRDWQKETFNFCNRVVQKFPPSNTSIERGYKHYHGEHSIVLTGHSLGGYTAIENAMRLGIKSRTFSSPATKIVNSYLDTFSNSLFLNNSINFVRRNDPVVFASGRHNENMVYYPSSGGIPLNNHYLNAFITEIIEPLATSKDVDGNVSPTNIYISPIATLGSGLELPVNIWR